MQQSKFIVSAIVLASAVLGGCATPNYSSVPVAQPYPQQNYPQQSYPQTYPQQSYPQTSPQQNYPSRANASMVGTVDSIYMNQADGNTGGAGIGAGAVVGGVVGGLLGNQVGGGSGKKAATVAGVVGGAMAGHQIEQRNSAGARNTYQIGIRLDNGGYRTVTQDNVADLQVGSRVRIDNDRAYRY